MPSAPRLPLPQARLYRGTPHNLLRLAKVLQRGDLVAVPTETVYGLAGAALNPLACRAIFEAKGRPFHDPLIVHLHSWSQVQELAVPNETAAALAEAFWPGPLTLVLPKLPLVPDEVTAGLPSVALRMPAHPLFRRLLRLCALPLAAPSANPFGYVSPTCAEHVKSHLGSKIRYILDGGASSIGLESTIVDVREPLAPRLLRPGSITRTDLELTLGHPLLVGGPSPAKTKAQIAPGLLKRHYSPRTPLELHSQLRSSLWCNEEKGTEAFLLLTRPVGKTPSCVHWLSTTGKLQDIGQALFAKLRSLDQAGYTRIHVETPTGGGLAEAINDRLRRAAALD